MKRIPTAVAALAAVLALVAAATPPARLLGTEVRRIPTEDRVLALTFNAAWNDTGLDTTLAVPRERTAPATFFPTGEFADRHPSAVRTMAAAGHGLGAILQLHVGTPEENGPGTCLDAEALPLIIDAVHARGYRTVDLRTLLDT
ncbi:polysaccharide deacetylase family protein [Kitasatospora sp. NPDC088351]|uniref:polysaccharide deacetylase family protein n=1 Tax=Kitasatospora sp. NPDC088351 TaxID=3155180 RepID=UPI003430FCB4